MKKFKLKKPKKWTKNYCISRPIPRNNQNWIITIEESDTKFFENCKNRDCEPKNQIEVFSTIIQNILFEKLILKLRRRKIFHHQFIEKLMCNTYSSICICVEFYKNKSHIMWYEMNWNILYALICMSSSRINLKLLFLKKRMAINIDFSTSIIITL